MRKSGFIVGVIVGVLAGAAAVLFTSEDNEYIRIARDKADDIKADVSRVTNDTKDQIKDMTAKAAEKAKGYKNQLSTKFNDFKDAVEDVVDEVEEKFEEEV